MCPKADPVWSFEPSLRSRTTRSVTRTQKQFPSEESEEPPQPIILTFYAVIHLDPRHQFPQSSPQIWTNAPLSDEPKVQTSKKGSWKSVDFKPLVQQTRLQSSFTTVWQAQLCLLPQPGCFNFTYRLTKPSSEVGGDPQIQWLGSLDDNGIISLIDDAKPEKYISEQGYLAYDSIQSELIEWLDGKSDVRSLAYHYPQSHRITSHLFTFKLPFVGRSQTPRETPTIQNAFPVSIQATHLIVPIEGLAFHRSKPTWFDPSPLDLLSQISTDLDTQLVIFRQRLFEPHPNNPLLLIYPFSSESQTSVIRSTSDSPLTIVSTIDCPSAQSSGVASNQINVFELKLLVVSGPQYSLREMMSIIGTSVRQSSSGIPTQPSIPFQQSELQHPLRYCTWNSLGPDFGLPEVLRVIEGFESNGVSELIDSVLLDDGWQDVNPATKTLQSFGPSKKFMDDRSGGDGLTRAVDAIRQHANCAIMKVGVWITINGYWDGLDPHSEKMKPYKLQAWRVMGQPCYDEQDKHHSTTTWFLPHRSCVYSFWDAYFSYLKSAGVSFVKVDNQASLDYLSHCLSDSSERPNSYRSAFVDTLQDLAHHYFGCDILHSMSHSPTIISKPIKKNYFRTSDDFFPDDPDFNAHRWHVVSNGFNSLLAIGLDMVPDFDMMMTSHRFNEYHASLRAFSCSPIYLTDPSWKHDRTICTKLMAPLKKGGIVTVQSAVGCVLTGRAFGSKAFEVNDSRSAWGLMKLGLQAPPAGGHQHGGGLIGIWNVKKSGGNKFALDHLTKRDVADSIGPSAIHLSSTQSFIFSDMVIYSRNQETFVLVEAFDLRSELKRDNEHSESIAILGLDENTFDILTCSSLIYLNEFLAVANLGLLDQYVGLSAVNHFQREEDQTDEICRIERQSEGDLNLGTKRLRQVRSQSPRSTFNSVDIRLDGSAHKSTNLNAAASQGKLCSLIYHLFFDRGNFKHEFKGHLKLLLEDFVQQPIRTVFVETLSVVKMTLIYVWKMTGGSLFGRSGGISSKSSYPPLLESGNDSLSLPSECASDVENEELGRNDHETEESRLLSTRQQTYGSASSSGVDHSSNHRSIETGTSYVQFETRFTARVGFAIVIKPNGNPQKESHRIFSHSIDVEVAEHFIKEKLRMEVEGILIENDDKAIQFKILDESETPKELGKIIKAIVMVDLPNISRKKKLNVQSDSSSEAWVITLTAV